MRYSALCGIFCITCSPLFTAAAQIGNNPPIPPSWTQRPGQSPIPTVHNSQPVEDPADRMRREQVEKLNLKHREQAKVDAAKLLELSTALKQQVDASTSTTVSAKPQVDIDKIINLAKSIKNNLRQY